MSKGLNKGSNFGPNELTCAATPHKARLLARQAFQSQYMAAAVEPWEAGVGECARTTKYSGSALEQRE